MKHVTGWGRLAFWAAMWGVVGLSLTPIQHLPPQVFDVWDKAQHAFGFAVLAVLGRWAYVRHAMGLGVGLLLLGAAIEVAQSATGWRQGEMADGLADAVGILFGLWLAALFKTLVASRRRTP